MLALAACAVRDSPEYLFEVKWNGHPGLGVPALGVPAAAGTCGARDRAAYQDRYPEMEVLAALRAGHHLGRWSWC